MTSVKDGDAMDLLPQEKCFVFDLDSFNYDDQEHIFKLAENHRCIFMSSEPLTSPLENWYYYDEFLKPFIPSPLTHSDVFKLFGGNASDIIYISKSKTFINNARAFFCKTILVKYDFPYQDRGLCPDLILPSADKISKLTQFDDGLCCEKYIAGSVKGFSQYINIKYNVNNRQNYLLVLGRYFGSSIYMHHLHILSRAIVLNKSSKSKLSGAFDSMFSNMFSIVIKNIPETFRANALLCSVPPHFDENNRFSNILESVSISTGIENIGDKFITISNYRKQKGLNSEERKQNVSGAFKINAEVSGKTIILLDDIITTGVTIEECTRTLIDAGAETVISIVLGANQFDAHYWNHQEPAVHCPDCGSSMSLYANSRDLSFFYSCTNCDKTISFSKGKQRLDLELNSELEKIQDQDNSSNLI